MATRGESGERVTAEPVTEQTLAEAQKLWGLALTPRERELVAEVWPVQLARTRRRRRVELPNRLGRAAVFDPRLPQTRVETEQRPRVFSEPSRPLPASDEEIAFATVAELSRWIRIGELSSRRLAEIYLERLRRIGPGLECVITLTEELALTQAERADRERVAGRWRGPLHGIPWGAKDLLDTAGVRTTFGVELFADRVPDADAAVVRRLADAGAVLVAKLALGELAMGDVWFGGTTRNPWDREQGSSGSSAGSAAATAAGLVGFALGSETTGSIESPCKRCGAVGLRPSFGRVPRSGAMTLCWSLDKLGPICRSVEDTALVLDAIVGPDPGDPAALDLPFNFDATEPVAGRRVGYVRGWFESASSDEGDRAVLAALEACGAELVEVELPDLPYDALMTILEVEAAAAFEELTLSDRDDALRQQGPHDWPNGFRRSWFVSAVELVQAERLRRLAMERLHDLFEGLDALVAPHWDGRLTLATNHTGHPGLTLRSGFDERGRPRGVTLYGPLFGEGRLVRIGMALEAGLGVQTRRPSLSARAGSAGV